MFHKLEKRKTNDSVCTAYHTFVIVNVKYYYISTYSCKNGHGLLLHTFCVFYALYMPCDTLNRVGSEISLMVTKALVLFLFCTHLAKEVRGGCFTLIVFCVLIMTRSKQK